MIYEDFQHPHQEQTIFQGEKKSYKNNQRTNIEEKRTCNNLNNVLYPLHGHLLPNYIAKCF